jgi:hypothetical protein
MGGWDESAAGIELTLFQSGKNVMPCGMNGLLR